MTLSDDKGRVEVGDQDGRGRAGGVVLVSKGIFTL